MLLKCRPPPPPRHLLGVGEAAQSGRPDPPSCASQEVRWRQAFTHDKCSYETLHGSPFRSECKLRPSPMGRTAPQHARLFEATTSTNASAASLATLVGEPQLLPKMRFYHHIPQPLPTTIASPTQHLRVRLRHAPLLRLHLLWTHPRPNRTPLAAPHAAPCELLFLASQKKPPPQ